MAAFLIYLTRFLLNEKYPKSSAALVKKIDSLNNNKLPAILFRPSLNLMDASYFHMHGDWKTSLMLPSVELLLSMAFFNHKLTFILDPLF